MAGLVAQLEERTSQVGGTVSWGARCLR
jgi:hypothetical protein